MRYLFLFLLVISFHVSKAQEEDNRRANYYEAFVEVKDSIDSIVVYKSKRELITFHQKQKVKKYIISLGEVPVGKKQFEGDMKTPEGWYFINERDSMSHYHKNLGISYPNTEDSTYAASQGLNAGGAIKIHGYPNNHKGSQIKHFQNSDWTVGCIAVNDREVDELYRWVIVNCPILILP